MKAFWITKLGDLGFVAGIVMLWSADGDLRLLDAVPDGARRARCRSSACRCIMFLIYLGAVGKSAQFPLHVWLPDAMEGPTPVSALIHAATMVTAGVFLRHARLPALRARRPTCSCWSPGSAPSPRCWRRRMACVESDIKRVLAYSTVSQLGYMMAAAGAGRARRGLPAPAHPRRLQGAAVPGRGRGDPRRSAPTTCSAWAGSARACRRPGIAFVVGTLALAGVWPLRRLLHEGGDPGRRAARRGILACRS